MSTHDLKLHPKYGLNPTIPTCFWCGHDRDELVLLGAAYKDEAPRNMVLDYSPCGACRAHWDRGIVLIECSERSPDNRPPLQGSYPTGRWAVVTDDYMRRILSPDELVQSVLKHRCAFVEVGLLERLGVR